MHLCQAADELSVLHADASSRKSKFKLKEAVNYLPRHVDCDDGLLKGAFRPDPSIRNKAFLFIFLYCTMFVSFTQNAMERETHKSLF